VSFLIGYLDLTSSDWIDFLPYDTAMHTQADATPAHTGRV